jgi:hypothetical protein
VPARIRLLGPCTTSTSPTFPERSLPLAVNDGAPTLFIRRQAYERVSLTRAALDEQLNLTPDEFRVEGDLVAVGPIWDADALGALIEQLEGLGLVYFDDFVELSGNWPEWLRLFAVATAER